MFRKRIQLGLIHVAVAMTLVPINSTLNRVMIKELAISATLVAVLASLPYLFSPIQVAIGTFSDRHPIAGYRRTPYVVLGLGMCVLGVILSPHVAFRLKDSVWPGLGLATLAFGAWGMGFNFATVAYLSLATELSGKQGRARTVAVMWFMMIGGIILTAIALGQMLDPYTQETLIRSFRWIAAIALGLGLVGLVGLEAPGRGAAETDERHSWGLMIRAILESPQATRFFWYLTILLIALLGQDVLLEPFAGEAYGLSVRATTRITSLWGVNVLLALLVGGFLEGRVEKKQVAFWGGVGAFLGFTLIAVSGLLGHLGMFYGGVVLLGVGTGLSTVSNLSLMLDMTTGGSIGLFIGAWGMASALARLSGSVLGGAIRDGIASVSGDPAIGYVVVFAIMAVLLLISLIMLRRVNVSAFQEQVESPSLVERAAVATEV